MNEVINIQPMASPQLSTANEGDSGTIKLNNLPPLDTGGKKSVNFGPGIEMLMNEKRRSSSPKSDINLNDLESLDNNIDLGAPSSGISRTEARKNIFNTMPSNSMAPPSLSKNSPEEVNKIKINVEEIPNSGPSINNLGVSDGIISPFNAFLIV